MIPFTSFQDGADQGTTADEDGNLTVDKESIHEAWSREAENPAEL
jgi:acyl CoA:acetate/3-ketoacid CoA transferase